MVRKGASRVCQAPVQDTSSEPLCSLLATCQCLVPYIFQGVSSIITSAQVWHLLAFWPWAFLVSRAWPPCVCIFDHWRQKPMHNVHLPLFCCLGGEFRHFLGYSEGRSRITEGPLQQLQAQWLCSTLFFFVSFSSIFYGCPLVVVPKQTPCAEDSTVSLCFQGKQTVTSWAILTHVVNNAAFLSFPTLGILGSLLKHQEHITLFFCPSISHICFLILLVNK